MLHMETSSITDLKFVKSVEVVPSKNLDIEDFRQAASLLSDVADVVTAPENPMGMPGIDPIISTYLIAREYNLIAMPHLTPRDKNRLFIHSQVITALKIGIRNFFVIGGDPISKKLDSKEVREIDVLQTINTIRQSEAFLKEPFPKVGIGSAFNPYREVEQEILAKKLENGSNFFISQIIYEAEHLKKDWIRNRSFRLSAGFMPLTRKSQIEGIKKMGVRFSDETLKKLDQAEDIAATSTRLILDAYDEAREYVDGIHVMPLGNNRLAKQILESI